MLNLHRDRKIAGENRGEMVKFLLSVHRQDGNVTVGGIGNLAPWGPSAVSEI